MEDTIAEYDFLGRIAALDTLAAFQQATVAYCSHVFDTQSVLAIRYHRDRQPDVLFRWLPDAALQATFDRYYARLGFMLDPFYRLALDSPGLAAHQLREIAPDRFETSDYFASYFGTTQLVDELGATLRVDADTAVHLSLSREAGQSRFPARLARRFKLMARVLLPKLRALSLRADPEPAAAPGFVDLNHRFRTLRIDDAPALSDRQAEIAALIVQGHSSRAIGLKLGISDQTVKVHRRNMFKKLQISSQSQLFGLLISGVSPGS
ncbi:helix-turn-helix transcriptional regulator [Pseudodonghicola flavimaris]|uniref:Helix-turn-helix transcriptional regulator n=1 Tax=Pseudodonghicola flavimaris TaxID=3050036 RepID=A0ABT7F2Q4_9RHOB|nr:helix-turn-helix transcriptional regulator [Pseudodonghicola flavimaris]MDK3018889.1 helix-turn-helix transcriptional regulator [Pseudodonghicola flavimaris]